MPGVYCHAKQDRNDRMDCIQAGFFFLYVWGFFGEGGGGWWVSFFGGGMYFPSLFWVFFDELFAGFLK